MRRRSSGRMQCALAALGMLCATAAAAADDEDRLERFRRLALASQGVAPADDELPDTYRAMYALIDEEIIENLATGSVFASPAFLQDRLDGFGEVWGGAALGVMGVGPLVVGVFQFTDAASANSVRVYGSPGRRASLLTTIHREGRPGVAAMDPGPGGAAQFVSAWEGLPSGRGTRALRVDLWRHVGDGVRMMWSSAQQYADGLLARDWELRDGELRVRYELRYPGWAPGCTGQTELEDAWRLSSTTGTFVLARRAPHHAWHRELRATVARLLDALARGDRQAVVALVPDPLLRRRLPTRPTAEPACDAPDDSTNPRRVSVAASDAGSPWELVWERVGVRWRLTAASPVLQ